jgi:gluconolactonase
MKTSISVALVLALGGCGGGDGATVDAAGTGDAAPSDAATFGDPLVGVGAVELVQGGFQFTEGPQWRDTEADLLFSDVSGNTTYRYVPGGGAATVFRMPSANANGLAIDPAGKVLAAEHGSRSITRAAAPIATMFEGARLNSPNDVIAAADGTIYFTDPPYGIQPAQQELTFNGVFRIATDGTLTAEQRGPLSARPNGVGLSPDGATLYVADTADGNLYRFPIGAGGALGTRAVAAATSGSPDGLAVDSGGNVFVATSTGVEVFAPSGTRWGAIAVLQQPANCAFGDSDHRTLYITARTAVYRVRLAHPGLPRL